MDFTEQLVKKTNLVVGNAQAELNYANRTGDTTKLREGTKLFQGAAGNIARATFTGGRMIGGVALVAGGIRTSVDLSDSLRAGEGYAALIPKTSTTTKRHSRGGQGGSRARVNK